MKGVFEKQRIGRGDAGMLAARHRVAADKSPIGKQPPAEFDYGSLDSRGVGHQGLGADRAGDSGQEPKDFPGRDRQDHEIGPGHGAFQGGGRRRNGAGGAGLAEHRRAVEARHLDPAEPEQGGHSERASDEARSDDGHVREAADGGVGGRYVRIITHGGSSP